MTGGWMDKGKIKINFRNMKHKINETYILTMTACSSMGTISKNILND